MIRVKTVVTLSLVIWLAWLPRLAAVSGTRGVASPLSAGARSHRPRAPIWISRLHHFNCRYRKIELREVNGTVALRAGRKRWTITFDGLTIGKLSCPLIKPYLPEVLEAVALTGRIVFSPRNLVVESARIDIAVPRLGTLKLQAENRPQDRGLLIRYRAEDLELLHFPGVMTGALAGLEPDGRIDLSGKVVAGRGNSWEGDSRLVLKSGQFHDSSYTYSGEGIGLVTRFRGRYDPQRGFSGKWNIAVHRGEILLDRFYADFGKRPLKCSLAAGTDARFTHLQVRSLNVVYPSVLKAVLAGSLDLKAQPLRFDIHLELPRQPLSPLLDTFVRDPLTDQVEMLKTAKWGGEVASSLRVNGSTDRYRVSGTVDLVDGALDLPPSKIHLAAFDLHLPINYSRQPQTPPGPTPSAGRQEQNGLLTVGELKRPPIDITSIRLPFRASRNRYRSLEPLIVPVLGGKAGLDRLTVSLGPPQGFQAEGRVRLSGIDLGPLFLPLLKEPLSCSLNSDACAFTMTSEAIRTQGRLVIDLLSGHLVIDHVRCRQPFSLGRTITLNARWRDIDLEQLTRYTHFGLITGRLKGYVRDLQIGAGGAIGFDLVLESQDDYKGSKRISVTAIDNLALVGSGQSPFVGSATVLTTFFRDFPYQKIGIECTLKNDYFSVRGLIREGDTEYLVKHGGLSGVNVINRTPGNRIAWNDMIQRLERIQYTDKIKVTKGGKR